jgi:hypothetical protein
MLRALRAGRLNTAPQDDEGETPFPDHRGFREELTYSEGEEFDIRDKLTADFAGLSPQQAGKVAKKVERLLADQNPHFEIADQEDD